MMMRYIETDTAEVLKQQLDALKPNEEIFSIYALGRNHFAWIRVLPVPAPAPEVPPVREPEERNSSSKQNSIKRKGK